MTPFTPFMRLLSFLLFLTAIQGQVFAFNLMDTKQPASSLATGTKPVPIIEYYGDSTVWGYTTGTGTQVAIPAPAAFADALGPKFEVINEGVNSTTACQLLNGTDGKHPPWQEQMAASKASFVIINHAINDQWRVDLPTYKSCLQQLARIAQKHGKKVLFETPNPIGENGSLENYVKAMKEVAASEKIPVIDQFRYLTTYLQGQSAYTICPDGLHPTDSVYVMKGRYAASVFLQLFSKKSKG